MDEALEELGNYVGGKIAGALQAKTIAYGELTLTVARSQILSVLKLLRDDARCRFEVLIDLCGVDYPGRENRFDVVYHLLSPRTNQRIRVKLETNETDAVPSAVGVFSVADWFEREAYDMYGILFSGHPDLKRIYMDEAWEGHPLRKDYPLRGYRDKYNPYGEEREEPLP